MIGRCLRPQDGKRAVVLDHVGNTLRLGHHLEPREWSLDGIKKQTREQAPSVKVCPQCFATSASQAQVCSDCGHEFRAEVRELKQVEGELVELKKQVFYPGDLVQHKATGERFRVKKMRDESYVDIQPSSDQILSAHVNSLLLINSAKKREQGSARDLQSLRELAQQRGYKPGWAERVYQARLTRAN